MYILGVARNNRAETAPGGQTGPGAGQGSLTCRSR